MMPAKPAIIARGRCRYAARRASRVRRNRQGLHSRAVSLTQSRLHGLPPDARLAHHRPHPRHAVRRAASAPARSPTPSTSPSASPTCSAGCSPRARSRQAFVPVLARTRSPTATRRPAPGRRTSPPCWLGAAADVRRRRRRRAADGLGAGQRPAKTPHASTRRSLMTRWMFPYIGFMSLVALAGGHPQHLEQFAVPAATPVLLNICDDRRRRRWLAPAVPRARASSRSIRSAIGVMARRRAAAGGPGAGAAAHRHAAAHRRCAVASLRAAWHDPAHAQDPRA